MEKCLMGVGCSAMNHTRALWMLGRFTRCFRQFAKMLTMIID